MALAPATDLTADDLPSTTAAVMASFLGEPRFPNPTPDVYKVAAFLLIHGDEDSTALSSMRTQFCIGETS